MGVDSIMSGPGQHSSRLQQSVAKLCAWLNAPAELCVLLMMLHMLADAAVRVVFGSGLEGMVESVTYIYMVGLAFLPVAMLESRSAHLRVEILADRLSLAKSRILRFLAQLVTAAVAGLMAWLTFDKAWAAWIIRDHVELTRWSLPTWPVQWVFPLGFGLMALAALVNAFAGSGQPTSSDLPRETSERSHDADPV